MKASIRVFLAVALVSLSGSMVGAQQSSQTGGSLGVAVGSQSAATPAHTAVLEAWSRAAAPCPVSLRAQHKADGTMVQTGTQTLNAHPKGLGQWLHLTLVDPQRKSAAAALITVHGFSDKARMTQTSGNGSDASQTMMVTFRAAGQTAEADLWVPGMTAIQTIDLHSVTFNDGSMQSFAEDAGCRIAPDPLMLIAGK